MKPEVCKKKGATFNRSTSEESLRLPLRADIPDEQRRRFLGNSMATAAGMAVAGMGLFEHGAALAQPSAVKEPVVIGYPNTKGVQIERVTYTARNMGTSIVANVFKPAGVGAHDI